MLLTIRDDSHCRPQCGVAITNVCVCVCVCVLCFAVVACLGILLVRF